MALPPSLPPLPPTHTHPPPPQDLLASSIKVGEKGDLVFDVPVTFSQNVDVNAMLYADWFKVGGATFVCGANCRWVHVCCCRAPEHPVRQTPRLSVWLPMHLHSPACVHCLPCNATTLLRNNSAMQVDTLARIERLIVEDNIKTSEWLLPEAAAVAATVGCSCGWDAKRQPAVVFGRRGSCWSCTPPLVPSVTAILTNQPNHLHPHADTLDVTKAATLGGKFTVEELEVSGTSAFGTLYKGEYG